MPRPKFPSPYCVLPSEVISRITSDQAHYDRDPERAERQQVEEEERRQMDEEQERQYWEECASQEQEE